MPVTQDLNGVWRFQPDPGDDGTTLGYARTDHDDSSWCEARVPGTFDEYLPQLASYEGAGWFRRTLDVPATWAGQRIAIHFEGVSYCATVWVNGHHAGHFQDGFLPFEFDISQFLNPGTRNTLAVRVDNTRVAGEVPGLLRGWHTYGGILREVSLRVTDPLRLAHVSVTATPSGHQGQAHFLAEIRNDRSVPTEGHVTIKVSDPEGRLLSEISSAPTLFQPGQLLYIPLACQITSISPWSPDQPVCYTADIELHCQGHVIHQHIRRFGFRSIEVRAGRLLLNGGPLFLMGFNRHEDSPTRNMAVDLATTRADLEAIKATGSNFIRLAHYPHHPAELDLCDELGLLVMAEIPMYWNAPEAEPPALYAQKVQVGARQLRALIRRDAHHPSIIAWSVSNETDETQTAVVEGNRVLLRLGRQLDPSRLIVHVSSRWKTHPNFDEDDVVCVNAYPSVDLSLTGQGSPDVAATWRADLERVHATCPGKPIIVTEFGYISFEGLHQGRFSEEAQAEALEREFSGMTADYVHGTVIWCWADHPWPPSLFTFGLAISPYGVMSRERHPLKAVKSITQLFHAKRGCTGPTPSPLPCFTKNSDLKETARQG